MFFTALLLTDILLTYVRTNDDDDDVEFSHLIHYGVLNACA